MADFGDTASSDTVYARATVYARHGPCGDTATPTTPPVRLRPLLIAAADGSTRTVGTFPTALHSDVRAVILGLKRALRGKGRPVQLSPERIAAVERALAAGSEYATLADLRDAIATWSSGYALNDAEAINRYYDARRADAYSAHNAHTQRTLARHALQMLPTLPRTGELVLDLGCGSGLSSATFGTAAPGAFTIGVDLSRAMLERARVDHPHLDFVQADISQPLPFREGAFEHALSVSTVQHLCVDAADGRAAEARLQTLFAETARRVRAGGSFACQCHPREPEREAALLSRACAREGVSLVPVIDQPYRSERGRWFFVAGDEAAAAEARPCAVHAHLSAGLASCALELARARAARGPAAGGHERGHESDAALSARQQAMEEARAHLDWLVQDHLRVAHRWLRLARRDASTPPAAPAADAGAESSGESGAGAAAEAASSALGPQQALLRGSSKQARAADRLTAGQAAVARELMLRIGRDADLTALREHTEEVLEVLHGGGPIRAVM